MFAVLAAEVLTNILLFSELISIPYALDLSENLSVSSCTSLLLLANRSMSPANLRLHKGLPPIEVDVWCSLRVSCMIFSRKILNRTGERMQPWQTPFVVLKKSPTQPLNTTALIVEFFDHLYRPFFNVETSHNLQKSLVPFFYREIK